MTEHAVVIAGGGPSGLMLAGELALAGIDVAIVQESEDVKRGARAIDVSDKVEDLPTQSPGTDDDERRQLDRHISLGLAR